MNGLDLYRKREDTENLIMRVLLTLNTPLTRRQIGEAIGRGRSPYLNTTIEGMVSSGKLVKQDGKSGNGKSVYTYSVHPDQWGGQYQIRAFVTAKEDLILSGACPTCNNRRRLKRVSESPRLHLFVCPVCNQYHVFQFDELVLYITTEA